MTLVEFCEKIHELQLSQVKTALSILWFFDESDPDINKTAGELSRIIQESGLGTPHSTKLGEAIRKTGLTLESKGGFRLKLLSRIKIREWLKPALGDSAPHVDQDLGFLPREVWTNTRDYIERVCVQLNGCYQFAFYDAASVLVRRLAETLLIESYEALRRENEIKDSAGNFLMLRDLVSHATGSSGLGVGRNTKEALKQIKEQGDLSAHNRRYNARKFDLDKVQTGVRIVAEELISLASLKNKT